MCSDLWQHNTLLDFGIWVSETTGEVRTKRKVAKFQSMQFIISENGACSFAGSLHKFHNGNDTNYNDFTFADLYRALQSLNRYFNIELTTAHIHSIEIGVNLELDYKPEIILRNIICYKNKSFDNLSSKGKRWGVICEYEDYTIKLYDKGHQTRIAGIGKYILRYEIKLHRQRMVKPFNISTLADLQSVEKVAPLLGLLIEKLNEIIFFDFKFKGAGLSESKLLAWKQYSNPNFWKDLNKKQRYKARQRYEVLRGKYGCIDWAKYCINEVAKKWNELAESKQETGRPFPKRSEVLQAHEKETFSNLECELEKVACDFSKTKEKEKSKNPPRYCISCGRQINGQKSGSRFCSEKVFGKSAKACRNKDSNRRLTIKRKIIRAMEKDLMLRITYQHGGETYTDTLGANEISLTREWLNKVEKVEVLKSESQQLTGNKAKEFLQKVSNNNQIIS
ncbi:MAG: hypothetical protein FWF54_05315 [Candidatus Azobacteroides sp.]|nr:hypothetical protein [Candidatus Azobacteroides sp.]